MTASVFVCVKRLSGVGDCCGETTREFRVERRRLLFEYPEQGAAAAAHGCVNGAELIQLVFYPCDFRMAFGYVAFKIVCERVAPCFDGAGHDVFAAGCRSGRHDVCKCFFRTDLDLRFYYCESVLVKIEIDRRQAVAYARGVCRSGVDEKGAVGPELGRKALHLSLLHAQTEHSV